MSAVCRRYLATTSPHPFAPEWPPCINCGQRPQDHTASVSARNAAVRAVAEALYARMWGSDEDVSAEAVAHYRDVAVADAECAIEALDAAGWSVVRLTPGACLHGYGCTAVGDRPGCTCGRPHWHQVVAGTPVVVAPPLCCALVPRAAS